MKIVPQSIKHLASTPNPLQLIEAAGRTCYKSEDKITDESAEKFVRMILKRGHDSVLEHASVTFRIVTDRGISHEIVRHRIGCSYSQESTRYCNYGGKEMEFIHPGAKPSGEYTGLGALGLHEWKRACRKAEDAYKSFLEKGATPQWARSVLPNSLKTEIVMTANFRAWRHFLRLRMATTAHPQIREVACMLCQWFYANYPVIVEDLLDA